MKNKEKNQAHEELQWKLFEHLKEKKNNEMQINKSLAYIHFDHSHYYQFQKIYYIEISYLVYIKELRLDLIFLALTKKILGCSNLSISCWFFQQ